MPKPARRTPDPMFEDARPLPSKPIPYKPEIDERLGDPAQVGFRLLCLDKAIEATPTDTKPDDIIKAAVSIRAYLLGEPPAQEIEAVRVAARAEAPSIH